MSAFIVSDTHINLLVSFAERKDITAYYGNPRVAYSFAKDAARLAGILHTANVESVNHRYDDHAPSDDYQYQFSYKVVPAIAILKGLDCLEYQSCELPDWEGTLAHALIQRIRSSAIHCLDGYEDAPWGFEEKVEQP